MSDKYILDGHSVVPADLMTWARWFETSDRHVANDIVGGHRVSTVFLGINHRFIGDGPPLVFETMIFGGPRDGWQERCSTWDEAEAMHARAMALVRGELN